MAGRELACVRACVREKTEKSDGPCDVQVSKRYKEHLNVTFAISTSLSVTLMWLFRDFNVT